ncbi:MAG TPA: O-antigen ligase family protein [Planctomycetota bacterium]|nr:O-antigen ligase family protein [Planctomycetota bacterium]
MSPLVPLMLFGWIPFAIAAFGMLQARTATLVVVIGGWLFLPIASYALPGIPDYTKTMAVALSATLGIALFAGDRLRGLRFCKLDVPMLAWCLVPGISSLANGRGPHDAISSVLIHCVEWGLPYLIGRAMFRDSAALDQLARALFVGGLVYVPLCLYEMRMSPSLHWRIYGFAQHSFAQHIRMGGYRPLVFMEHGLMVGLWMSIATVGGFALWWRGGLQRLAGMSAGWLLLVLFAATVLCKSMGALALLALGAAAVYAVRAAGKRVAIWVLVAAPVVFVFARVICNWQARELIDLLQQHYPDRAQSVEFRINSEQVFMPGIWHHPWFGWSSWGYTPTFPDPDDKPHVARDSYWLITSCCFGLVGLALFFCVHLAPIVAVLRKLPVPIWTGRHGAGLTALVVAICMFVGDCLFNAMINPVYTMALGGLTSFAAGLVTRPALATLRPGHRQPPWGRYALSHR